MLKYANLLDEEDIREFFSTINCIPFSISYGTEGILVRCINNKTELSNEIIQKVSNVAPQLFLSNNCFDCSSQFSGLFCITDFIIYDLGIGLKGDTDEKFIDLNKKYHNFMVKKFKDTNYKEDFEENLNNLVNSNELE